MSGLSLTLHLPGTFRIALVGSYFAIGKMQASLNQSYLWRRFDVDGASISPSDQSVSVSPESAASTVFLYYSAFGSDQVPAVSASTYQGKQLNPSYFRDKVYFHVDFNKFGVYSGIDNLFWAWDRGDTVTLAFDVTTFVIGEWKVQDIQKIPDVYGRFVRTDEIDVTGLGGLLASIGSWFNNPLNWVWIVLAVIVLLAIFAPGALAAVIALVGGRKKN